MSQYPGEPGRYDFEEERNPFRQPFQMSWIDRQFANTPMLVLIAFPFCCGIPAFIFALLGVILCQDSIARRNAIIVLCLSVIGMGLAFMLGFMRGLAEAQRGNPGYR
jgi:hypothetical protein